MTKSQVGPIALLAALCLFWCVTCVARERKVVSWTAVKQEIARYICIEKNTAADGSVHYCYKHGADSPCVEEPEQISGMAKIMADAQPLLIDIQPEDVGFSYDTSLTLDSLQRCLQNAYLSNERFLRPILRRLEKKFASADLACSDCPVLAERPVRVISVAEFLPYLVAYAWPDDVHIPNANNGNAKREVLFSIHVCVAINGVDETIDHPDPYFAYLAFTVAANSKQFIPLAFKHIRALVREDEFRQLVDDSARTRYLRQHLGERLGQDKHLITAAKRLLKEYYDDLLVRLE